MVDPRVTGCKGKLAGVVALIFLSGAAAGGLTMKAVDHYRLKPQALVLNQAEKEMAVQHFRQELALNDDQTQAIESILDAFIMEQANLMQEMQHSRVVGHEQILRILNEDQRKRFQKVLSEINNKQQN
jgi:propanediol dehydratase small subunit